MGKMMSTSDFLTKQNVISIDKWMIQQSKKDLLRFITCGSVDDGKSTLIGRLLWESQHVFEDQIKSLQADSKRYGTQGNNLDYALLVDSLSAEREQGITIDVAYRFFSTANRKFIVADTPGHEQFTRNMITGASNSDAAILLIDAQKGLLTQTRRHAYLVSLLGIKHIILAINKMDLVNYQESIFNKLITEFSEATSSLEFNTINIVPISALNGDNVICPSKNMKWYRGNTLLGFLENIEVDKDLINQKVIFPIQHINRPNANFRGLSGTLVSGQISLGDKLRVTHSGKIATLTKIVTADGNLESAKAGDAITLLLDQEIDISRGDILSKSTEPLQMTDQFEAMIVWMNDESGFLGRAYEIKIANQYANVSLTNFKYKLNINTQAQEPCKKLELNDIALVNLAVSKPLVFEPYSDSHELGAFILIDKFTNATVAAGMIKHNLRRAQNVHHQATTITRVDRERLNGHKGIVIWFTGLSASGKSTLANALEQQLHLQGKRTYILDGDNFRQGLNRDLGFTEADRIENIRRVAEVAKLMMDAGLIVITAFISPFRAERDMAKHLIGEENFIEVFVDTPLAVCEQRDPKGLYRKARLGQIPNMTGISSPYEPPENPTISIDGGSKMSSKTLIEAIDRILS